MNKKKILSTLNLTKIEMADWFYEFIYDEKPMGRDDYYWIGGGTVLGIGDIFVSLDNIVDVMEDNISKDVFYSWYSYSVEHFDNKEEKFVNLKSYSRIRGKGSHEEYLSWKVERERLRGTDEYKKATQESLDKIYQEGVKELEKCINAGV